jgi:oxygen-independent coproporphyrinogen-3 oxidase
MNSEPKTLNPERRILGLYIHIPFCARRCPYCDFAISVGAKDDFKERYLAALKRELEIGAKSTFEEIQTINLGGGTPTALSIFQLQDLMRTIRRLFSIADDAEISIEGNPEFLEAEKLQALREAGWNRLSLGAQSFDEAVLKKLGRAHSPLQIESTFRNARNAGFDNLNLDLIYGVPGQSLDSWKSTLERAAQLEPDHLSCYALTIEPQTPFANWIEQGRMPDVDDDMATQMMDIAASFLHACGFSRYEVSNWTKLGFECRHNLAIWRGGNYLAAGCGAHGHQNGLRWWNERNAPKYVTMMEQQNTAKAGEEELTALQRARELVLLGLRLKEGFRWENLQRFGLSKSEVFNNSLNHLIFEKLLLSNELALRVHPEHINVTDAIARKILC